MSTVHKIHDHYFRDCMKHFEVAHEFFDAHLPESLRKIVDLNTLELQSESFIEPQFKEIITDILYSVKFNLLNQKHSGYLYLLAEHQSTPDRLLPIRLLRYMLNIMLKHIEKSNNDNLPVIIPMVFYQGKVTPYPFSLDLFDLFHEKERTLAREYLWKPAQLIDVQQIPETLLEQRSWLRVMETLQKWIYSRDILTHFKTLIEVFKELETGTSDSQGFILQSILYVVDHVEADDIRVITELLKGRVSDHLEGKIMTLAQHLEQKGMQKGLHQGWQQGEMAGIGKGIEQEKLVIAQNLLREGVDLHLISRVTGLSGEQVRALQKP